MCVRSAAGVPLALAAVPSVITRLATLCVRVACSDRRARFCTRAALEKAPLCGCAPRAPAHLCRECVAETGLAHTMTSSTKAARARRAQQAQQQRAFANGQPDGDAASPLEDSLRALNAKLIARLRASEAVAADAVAAKTVAQQALQTAQRGRKSVDGSIEQLSAHRDALEAERDQLKLNCERLQTTVDQLTQRVVSVSDELGGANSECHRLTQLHQSVAQRCDALEKHVVEGKDKLDAERMVISSLERQLEQQAATVAKRGAAAMSPQSYSSIDTGDTLRSDTCVSAAGASHTAIRVHDECDSAVAEDDTNMIVHDRKRAGLVSWAFETVTSIFERIWRWGADLVAKLLSSVGVRRASQVESVPLLRA